VINDTFLLRFHLQGNPCRPIQCLAVAITRRILS
jgi:hypothetical protein